MNLKASLFSLSHVHLLLMCGWCMAVLLPGKSLDAHHGPGIIIDSPENEEITAMFEDPAGNKIFLCKQGSHPAPCNMLILRFSPSGLLNLQSVLAIPDTSVILYAGFGTPEGQYVFTGVIREPVITNYPAYCMLVSVVTDPSFNVTAIRRYPIGPEYCMIDGMYVCSHDAFALTVACNTGDFAGSNHYNDLVIRRFNASGELILEKNFHFAWPQKVVAVVHPGGSSQHCLLAEGFSDQSFLHLLYLDPDWNIQDIFPLLPGDFFNDPLSARWIDSLSMMIICEHNVSIIDSDIRCMHVSGDGTIMNFFDLVSPDKIDWPATDRGIHAVYDSSFTFLGAGNSFPFSYISTISVTRMTTGLQTVWTKTYSDIENYFIVGAFPLAGGSLLTAASFTVPGVSPYQRGLIFFRLDEQGEWMSLEEPEEDAAAPFEVYPNPGGDQLNISCAIPGPWSVSVISSDGRLCRESNSMVSAGILSMEGLPSGLYTLCFTKQQSRLYKKWIKR